ncbi:phage head-tail connector protein [Staphylococcus chromogenes]|uniref:phage head-tail connector protein n=1 Tax=Staphylococcus chromogenes TaxID=46126 RepID=UPI0010ACC040|nr:phage head-tail connector protein [Staphylococcus chromogenes]TJY13993.1 phage head-tail connector protein [Staphylococcus chromogenes]
MATLDNVKTMLAITDNKQDALLSQIIENTEKRLLFKLPIGFNAVPSDLSFIVEEVAVKRFNRIGAEGMQSESVEGRSATFRDDDFDEYMADIEKRYPDLSASESRKGYVNFY